MPLRRLGCETSDYLGTRSGIQIDARLFLRVEEFDKAFFDLIELFFIVLFLDLFATRLLISEASISESLLE